MRRVGTRERRYSRFRRIEPITSNGRSVIAVIFGGVWATSFSIIVSNGAGRESRREVDEMRWLGMDKS